MKRKYKDIIKSQYQQDLILKYLSVLNHDEYEELQEKLNSIETIEDANEKRNAENGLQLWLASKYVLASNLCLSCANYDGCKRTKGVKSCKLWEGRDLDE